MKFLLIALLSFMPQSTFDANFSAIESALKAGDAEKLGQYFDNKVEVSVTDANPVVYNKQKAKELVGLFFKNNKPSGFRPMHQGVSKGQGYQYYIGNLSTSTGNFRVTVVISVDNSQFLIQEIGFDKQ